ncbi:MAG: hypothetical protein IIZ26_00425 [Oscillospiraceae bacterium]|nr:hypothetical protein [Oscillospiraceae bacterium]
MYKGFYYEIVLSAIAMIHCVYMWLQWRRNEKRQPWKRFDAVVIIGLLAVYVLAVAAGFVAVARGDDPVAAKGFGALSILMVVWLDFKVTRACGK